MPDHQKIARPADLLRAGDWQFEYRQKASPRTTNLDLLTYGTYRVAGGGVSDELYHRGDETLLFCLAGGPTVEVAGTSIELSHYDTLYIPRATPYQLANPAGGESLLVVCRAPAEATHQPFHSRWDEVRADESRIRHLDGKDVFLMFDVSEPADRLLAGYTVFQPHARSWPPHNHTDQEEVYIFTKGRGAIEVYADEKTKTFVHGMQSLDAATIPLLNYHPVFSHGEELHFIWCLAGARYWIGDKHREFMDSSVDELTT